MTTIRELKLAKRIAGRERGVIGDLQALARDIDRCELVIGDLQKELEEVNVRHAGRKTTRDDIHYLEDLLACAKKKLAWEKLLASLQKRTPEIMETITTLVNHPQSQPDEETRNSLMQSLRAVQESMNRLQAARSGVATESVPQTEEPDAEPQEPKSEG